MASSKYDTVVDLAKDDNSHTMMVELVGSNKRVLDVGCANGYLARVLVEHGCTVSGVEFDRAAAEEARPVLQDLVVGDLEQLDLATELGTGRFDVVVFGDVLEHLRDPLPVLRAARELLAPDGCVVISIPNIAHGDVRLQLLQGRFDYRPLGLLDSTHIRFFTRDNLKALLRDAGFAATEFLRTTAPLFGTELAPERDSVPAELVAQMLEDPDATTYQFVVRAVPEGAAQSVAAMREQFELRLEQAEQQIQQADRSVEQERDRSQRVLAQVQAEVAERDLRLTGMHEQVVSRDEEIARLRDGEIPRLQDELARLHAEYAAVQQTKAVRTARAVRGTLGRLSPPAPERRPGDVR